MAAVQPGFRLEHEVSAGELVQPVVVLGIYLPDDLSLGDNAGHGDRHSPLVDPEGVGRQIGIKGGAGFGVYDIKSQVTLAHDNGVDPLRICGPRDFDIDLILALPANNRLGETELIDAAVEHFHSPLHGVFPISRGQLPAEPFGENFHIGLYDHRHSAGQVQSELKGVAVALFQIQRSLPVSGFDGVEHYTLAGKGRKDIRCVPLAGEGFLFILVGFFRHLRHKLVLPGQVGSISGEGPGLYIGKRRIRHSAGKVPDLLAGSNSHRLILFRSQEVPVNRRKQEGEGDGNHQDYDDQTTDFTHSGNSTL